MQPLTRIGAVLVTLMVLSLALWFGQRQRRPGATGGAISGPKLAWLSYAVLLWFLLTPIIALDPALRPATRWVLGLFSACMWLRGGVELYMLFVARNWRCPYGIAHDVLCIGLLVGGLRLLPGSLPRGDHPLDLWIALLLGLILCSLVVEIVYASLFHRAAEGRTTGESAVWFAAEDPRFQRINRLTTALNVPLFLGLAVLLFGVLRGG